MAGSELAPIVQYSLLLPPVGVWVRVSVPVWGIFLSRTLPIVAFGEPLPHQLANRHAHLQRLNFNYNTMRYHNHLWGINPSFSGLSCWR